jgi:hypothetical protein
MEYQSMGHLWLPGCTGWRHFVEPAEDEIAQATKDGYLEDRGMMILTRKGYREF